MTREGVLEHDIEAQRLLWVAKAFRKPNRVGWIMPTGRVIEVELFGHLGVFMEDRTLLPEVSAFLDPHFEEHKFLKSEDFQASADPDDDHVPWHQYSEWPFTPEEAVAAQATGMVYASGWGRIGTYRKAIEMSCLPVFERKLRRPFSDFAALVGREPVFTHAEPWPPAPATAATP
jgi:hypothetical protein